MASDGLPRRIVKVRREEDGGSKRNMAGSQQTRIGFVHHGWTLQDGCFKAAVNICAVLFLGDGLLFC